VIKILSLLLSVALSQGPSLPFPGPGAAAGFTGPTFVAYTFVAETNSSNIASITSPAITLSSGDLVFVFCRSGRTASDPLASSSPANTFTELGGQNTTGLGEEKAAYAFGVASGSTTFTCTPNTSSGFQSMIVLQYRPGSLTAKDVDTGTSDADSTSTTSNTFSTANANELILFCATQAGLVTFTAGNIGGVGSTLRGFSGASNSAVDAACEERVVSSVQTNITAAMSSSVSHVWAGVAVAFK